MRVKSFRSTYGVIQAFAQAALSELPAAVLRLDCERSHSVCTAFQLSSKALVALTMVMSVAVALFRDSASMSSSVHRKSRSVALPTSAIVVGSYFAVLGRWRVPFYALRRIGMLASCQRRTATRVTVCVVAASLVVPHSQLPYPSDGSH